MRKTLALILAALSVGAFLYLVKPRPNPLVELTRSNIPLASAPAPTPTAPKKILVWRHSLIPGGVESIEYLRARVSLDPALQKAYEGFDWSRARLFTFPKDRPVFMSYRLGDKIRWTRRTVLVKEGAEAITDGVMVILTRCGNLVSFVPVEPSEDLPPQLLETPVESDSLTLLSSPEEPAPGSVDNSTPAALPPVNVVGLPPVLLIPSGVQAVHLPEPSTLYLLGVGLIFLVILRRKRGPR